MIASPVCGIHRLRGEGMEEMHRRVLAILGARESLIK